MGVYEENKYPFLAQEKEMIREAFKRKVPILGICLGAQLIASALGKEVYPYRREFGWFTVNKIKDDTVTRELPEKLIVFQWHNDTFNLPEGAKLLYAGDLVRNQAFRIGNAIGLQFHLEVTSEIVRDWVRREESLSDEQKEVIIAGMDRYMDELHKNCERLFKAFLNISKS